MSSTHELELLLNSSMPIIVVQTHEEKRLLDMLVKAITRISKPLFKWTVTEGLQRYDLNLEPQPTVKDPATVLRHIKAARMAAIYVLLDFHPYLGDPVHVRHLKDIAQSYPEFGASIVLLSHEISLPDELQRYSTTFELALPTSRELRQLVQNIALQWQKEKGIKLEIDATAFNLVVQNLQGLTVADARRVAHNIIYDDGAIVHSDVPEVARAKYRLLDNDSALTFELDTSRFSDVGGMHKLKQWLYHRQDAFTGNMEIAGMDPPKGILLLGVQGCGKSLAAKAVAGLWGLPLLRLDFGTLFNKYIGETERNLREALKMAETMSPCVLWIDEIEKGIAPQDSDSGPSRRVLATLLTWMAEKTSKVFLVSTANDITALPPELIRKGRFDEIFFVDLPAEDVRKTIIEIHLRNRNLDPAGFNLDKIANVSGGFSGAELEQAIVSATYASHASKEPLTDVHIQEEIARTRPLSVVMAEQITELRSWASGRTVPCD